SSRVRISGASGIIGTDSNIKRSQLYATGAVNSLLEHELEHYNDSIMIDWHTIETVLLDMDGTLLDLHFDNYFWLTHLPERYAEAHGVPLNDAQTLLENHIRHYEG